MKNINKSNFLIIIFFILLILLKAYFFTSKYPEDKYISNEKVYVEALRKKTESSVTYNVKIGEKFNHNFILKIYMSDGISKAKWEEYTNLKYGDVIKINGKIQIPEIMNNPGEFKYKYYLYSNNIYGEIVGNKIIGKVEYKLNIKEKIIKCIYMYKEYLGNTLDKYMDNKYSVIAKSIIYGDTLDIDEEIKTDFEKAGVSHMMAISGSNIVGLVTVVTIVFSGCKLRKNVSKFFSIMVIVIYIILTGASLSTLRAGIMCIICTLQNLEKRKSGKERSTLNNLLLTILLILIYAPFSVLNTGFILSVLATLGIILFNSYFTDAKQKVLLKVKSKSVKSMLDILLTNLFLTLSVQILIFPVQVNSFNLISLTSILSNVFCGIISSAITVLGSVYVVICWMPIVSYIISKLLSFCIIILLLFIKFFRHISLEINVMDLNLIAILIYYISVFLIYLRLYLTKVYTKKKLKLKKYTLIQCVCIIVFILCILFSSIYFKHLDNYISFFNVGQGELSLIKSGENMVVVDIGSMKTTLAYNSINGYFKKMNIDKIDAVILSHIHSDHINGLESFVKEYKVNKIIYAKPFGETEEYINFLRIVKEYNLESICVKSGDNFSFGDIQVEILLPNNKEILSKEDKEGLNTNSLVCKISIKDKDVIYMGDATHETEKILLEKYSDSNIFNSVEILKVGHHGSKTSTSKEYIEKVLPKYAVISAKEKYYGHPHKDTLEVLKENNVQIYVTEKVGYIKFNLNKL